MNTTTKIKFRTNIDHYNKYSSNVFPDDFTNVPRKGDKIEVKKMFKREYEREGLPTNLTVVGVTWKEGNEVVCELHYSNHQIEVAKITGAKLFG